MAAQKQGDNGLIQRDRDGFRYSTPPPLEQVGYEKLTVGVTAVPFTLAAGKFSTQADTVLLRVEVADIRWRGDGVDPDGDTGMLLKTTDNHVWLVNVTFDELARYKFIRDAAADGTLHVNYYRILG